MINLFPYTDAHELNLDWVVEQVKANDTKVKDLTNTVINMHLDFDSKADKATTYTKTEVNTLLADKADISSLASVATSGNYNDLTNKPTIPAAQVNSDWDAVSGVAQILNKPTLAAVATSGSYTDLSNKPTIPAAQVNSDWDAASGVAQILNKPSLSPVATSGDYNDLINKPALNWGAQTLLYEGATALTETNYSLDDSLTNYSWTVIAVAWNGGINSNVIVIPRGLLYNQPLKVYLNNDRDATNFLTITNFGSDIIKGYSTDTRVWVRIYGIK